MKLKYAKIVNFRSIQEIKVNLDPSCRILVGINESGKSNILRALSMIGEEFKPTPEDIREPLPREKSIQEAYIWFVFGLDKNDTQKIFSALKPKLLSSKTDVPMLKDAKKKLSLHDFCALRDEGLYSVDLMTQKKNGSYWAAPSGYEVLSNWKKPSKNCPADYQVQVGGTATPLVNYSLVNTDDYTDIPETHLEDVDVKHINSLIGGEITKLVTQSLPKVIFWQYDEKNLLPPSVDINAFAANPDSCIPLKNMFMLAGIKDIGAEINQAKTQSPNKLRNLLRRVATHSTNHFRNVWKEYKEISFALEPNANTIEANIVEKNYWRMSQRSDGVKRFTTFLLHISANVRANLITNSLLLIDEPDMSLHPSGSRYLRDELIDIAKKNYVVFSTHSIFMIDKENINRHIIVKKEHEKTNITNATKSNVVDEEVLFNALNYTVFDILQKNNLIFEGWRDKKLFQTAVTKIPDTHTKNLKELKDKLKNVGLCHAEGVKDVRNITPLLELANRNCIIVSDSDAPAKEKQKEYQKLRGYGVWKRYDEISSGATAETADDFIKEDIFKKHLDKTKSGLPSLTGDPILSASGRMATVKKWLTSQGVSQEQAKEFLDGLKSALFDDLKVADIDASYYDFLKNFMPLLDIVVVNKQ